MSISASIEGALNSKVDIVENVTSSFLIARFSQFLNANTLYLVISTSENKQRSTNTFTFY